MGLCTGTNSWAILLVKAFWQISMTDFKDFIDLPINTQNVLFYSLMEKLPRLLVDATQEESSLGSLRVIFLMPPFSTMDLEDSTIFTLLHLLQWNNRFFTNCLLMFSLASAEAVQGPWLVCHAGCFGGESSVWSQTSCMQHTNNTGAHEMFSHRKLDCEFSELQSCSCSSLSLRQALFRCTEWKTTPLRTLLCTGALWRSAICRSSYHFSAVYLAALSTLDVFLAASWLT